MSSIYYGWEIPTYSLSHHGVKGMRWGVRHDPERSERRLRRKNRKLEKRAKRLGGTREQLEDAMKIAKVKKKQNDASRRIGTAIMAPFTGLYGAGIGTVLGGPGAGTAVGAAIGALSPAVISEALAIGEQYIHANNMVREMNIRELDSYNRLREVETHHRGS